MATRHISPASDSEGGLGRPNKRWGEIHGVTIKQNGKTVVDEDSISNFLEGFSEVGDVRIPDRDNNNALKRLVIKGGKLQFESIE